MDETQTLRLAREAIQQGDKAAGQRLLLQAIRANPRNETAWLWLSAIVDDPAKERDCLQKVLEINPANDVAKKHLAKYQSQPTATVVARPIPPSAPAPAPVVSGRSDILDNSIRDYVYKGYTIQSRTDNTAQLVKKKEFNIVLALICLLTGIGLILYLLFYLAEKEKTVYLEVDRQGELHVTVPPMMSTLQAVLMIAVLLASCACLAIICNLSPGEWEPVSMLILNR